MHSKGLFFAAFVGLASIACSSSTEATSANRGTTRLELKTFTVAPGQEGLKCQTFASPVAAGTDIVAWKAIQGHVGHHMLAWVVDDAVDTGIEDCSGAGDVPPLFQSQEVGAAELVYPEGIAAHLGPRQGLRVQIHYLNGGAGTASVDNAIELTTASESGRRHVQPLRYENLQIDVPKGAGPTTITRTCTLPRDIDLVMMTGHMHAHGAAIEATLPERGLYLSRDTAEPAMTVFAQPVPVSKGAVVTMTCTYTGDREHALRFGDSLERDEMCVVVGSYVTRDGSEPGPITCDPPRAPGACLSCLDALVAGTPDKACKDGAPSSFVALGALTSCTCDAAKCGSACADTCGAARGRPSDTCNACLTATCAAEQKACFASAGGPP